jgi:hypothetical protein
MIFGIFFTFFGKHFRNQFKNPAAESAGCTRCSAPASAGSWGPRVNRPHPTTGPEQRGGVDRPTLAGGEVAGYMVTTSAFLKPRLT